MMEDENVFFEYRYMDNVLKKHREEKLKNFLIDNNYNDLKFYDLDMYHPDDKLSSRVLYEYNKSIINSKIILNKYQIEILNILKNNNLFLSATTIFGKTFLMLEFIKRNKTSLNNIIFIIPTLALMNELLKKLYNLFSNYYNICINSSENFYQRNIFVFVPERSDKDFLKKIENIDIDFLVFDEIYKLQPKNDSEVKTDDRIIYMNKVYLDLVNKAKKVALLGPYINNVSFDKTKLEIVKYYTNFLPVYNKIDFLSDDDDWINHIKKEHQLIYFSGPRSIYRNIGRILEHIPEDSSYIFKYKKEIEYLEEKIGKEWYVISLLKRGIGIHHGKTPMFLRKFYENEYNAGNIKILLCTDTLMEGINTPTNSLIVVDDPGTAFRLNNLIGRVGRLNIDNPTIGNIIFSNSSILDNLTNTNDWFDLKILAENEEIVSDDEIIYLDKKYNDKENDKQKKIEEKLNFLNNYGIGVNDIINQNLQLGKCFDYINNNLYEKLAQVRNLHEFIDIGIKLIPGPWYYFQTSAFDNLEYDYSILPYKYYIGSLLSNQKYKQLVSIFNSKYNTSYNITNINIFIDSLYELNNFIKFKFSKLVQYINLYETNEIKSNVELQKYIGMLSSYKAFDTASKILDDLGINEEDSKRIMESLNISNVTSTSSIIRIIKQNKKYLLSQDLSPFTINNISNI